MGCSWRLPVVAAFVVLGTATTFAATASAADDSVTPLCNGQPCGPGWNNSAVFLSWSWTGGTATSGCANQDYIADTNATVSCDVSFTDGSADDRSFNLKVEISQPMISVTPARPPDSNGWYNHPVDVSFVGASFSGIASCTPTATFAGPDQTNATLAGSCTDNAGKTVGGSLSLNYDATPPPLTATADPGDQFVTLLWQTPSNLDSFSILRSPGENGATQSVVDTGATESFTDSHVRNGTHYTYTITARDQAGNVSVLTLGATPGVRLLSPQSGARLAAPPLLRWTEVQHARYYNVQLYRGGSKIFSAWPTGVSLQLPRSWRFLGRRYRLKPGRYRWYVWPGYGKRNADRYGKLIGVGSFVVP